MKNIYVAGYGILVVAIVTVGTFGIVPGVSYAQYDYSYDPVYDHSYTPDYSYSPTYDYSYDPVYDYSYTPDYSYSATYDYSYDPVYDYSYTPDYSYNPVYDYSYDPVYDLSYDPVYDYSYDSIYDYSYDPVYDYSYDPVHDYYTYDVYDSYVNDYTYVDSYGAVYTYATPVGYSYSTPTYSHSYPVTVSSPKVTYKTVDIAKPMTIAHPTKTKTTKTTPITVTSPSTNTYTYTDNSINDSFNVTDSYNVTTVTKVADKQKTIQYVYSPTCTIFATPNSITSGQSASLIWSSQYAHTAYLANVGTVGASGSYTVNPSQTTTYTLTVYNTSGQAGNCQTTVYVNQYTQQPYCTLTANPSYIQNGAYSVLSWTSQNATSAWLSDGLGSVALSGRKTVQPEANRIYTLTVTNAQGRTATCQANVYVSGSYVSLTQIPYTGFDFGPFGNAMYWLALILFAGCASYLTLFYRGGVVGLTRETYAMLVPASGEARADEMENEKVSDAPAQNNTPVNVEDLPVRQSEAHRATKDTMSVVVSRDGSAPRIVISRN